MQSRLVINLVLLALIVGLGSFLLLSEEESIEKERIKLSDVEADTINRIQINNISSKEIHFTKDDNQWWMTEPYQAPAHPTRIKALLGILDTSSVHQLNINETELNRFQLQPANQTLTLNDLSFQFGDVNPLDKTRYVLHKDRIHLIHDNLYHQLSTNPTFFINPKILPAEEVISLIETPDYDLKREEQNWSFESEKDKTDEEISQLVNSWKNLEANTIQPLSFEEAYNKITIHLTNGKTIDYWVMPESPTLVLGRKDLGLQFHINEYNSNRIFPIEIEETGLAAENSSE